MANDIAIETQEVDCTISSKIDKLIKAGELFSGEQEFSYKSENASGLVPQFCMKNDKEK